MCKNVIDENLPHFKYHPNAYRLGLFKQGPERRCTVCSRDTNYVYSGPFYCIDDVDTICPWCIHDGQAAQKFNGTFHGAVEYNSGLLSVVFNDDTNQYMYFMGNEQVEPIHDKSLHELLFRTPSYSSWQEPQWLRHCDDFCTFIGYLDQDEWMDLKEELQEEVVRLQESCGLSLNQLADDIGLYLFQCPTCGKYRLHTDYS
ncbi:CbrC family protein [Paenibacillus elgii]|uniref:CbrC family protein n=1 Tax=Paenibacillus elgii TaxID=189691 RepID=UPI000248DFE6|nr:CbrC family protein [Paenibacillus elgii]